VRERRVSRREAAGEERREEGKEWEGFEERRARSSAAIPRAAREAMAGAPRIYVQSKVSYGWCKGREGRVDKLSST
jgi:hypothetical protein